MTLTSREKKVLHEIRVWENKLYNHAPNDFQLLYDKYIERSFHQLPEKVKEQFFEYLDNTLFHLNALIQGSQLQLDAKDKIIISGRIFNEEISEIEDMKLLSIDQLQYIANQQIARHRIYSLVQGGMSGTGRTVLLGTDIPGMAYINLRIVQLIALTYGIEVNTPYEMMTALKVFNVSTLPLRLQGQGWEELMNELHHTDDSYFYEGQEDLANIAWVEHLIKQGLKGMAIVLFRKKLIQGVPFVSMSIGASMNYQLTRKITDFAHKYYQMRYLYRKHGGAI